MALSSQWSQSVVVRSERGGEAVVPSFTPSNASARAFAASGNPIIIRPRDAASGLHAHEPELLSPSGGVRHLLRTTLLGHDVSETYWIPDASRGEVGLLEAIHRRGPTNRTNVLLQSRPLPELQRNFSTSTGRVMDLSHDAFRLSKAAVALQRMNYTLPDDDDSSGAASRAGGASGSPRQNKRSSSSHRREADGSGVQLSISARDFKASMRASLQALQHEDYYIVMYRDYSTWAVKAYPALARSDSLFGKKYVAQAFAVHVGREPGELIPITEAQFLYAVDIMQRQLLNQLVPPSPAGSPAAASHSSYAQHQLDIDYAALNADQFRSLGALLGDGLRPVGVEGEERRRAAEAQQRHQAAAAGSYHAPAWYDWSPSAIRTRVQHQLSLYYFSVGRLAVQLTIIGLTGFIFYRALKHVLPIGEGDRDGQTSPRRGGSRRAGSRRRGFYIDGDDDYRPSFFRSVIGGPKSVFDYMLAPRDDAGYY